MMKLEPISKLADVITGFPFDGARYGSHGIRVVRGENVTIGALRWDTTKCWADEFEHHTYYSLQAGDVVIGMDGSRVGHNRARIDAADLPLLLAQRVACLRAKRGVDPAFLYYLFKSDRFPQYVERIQTGSTVPHISKDQIETFMVPCPEPNAQQRIGQILSALDAKITLNQRINAELEAMAKLLYDYWFVQFDFPMSAAQAKRLGKPKLEGKPYKSSGGPMVYNAELKREVPEGWGAGTLADLGEIIGGSTPSTANSELFTKNGTAWITPKDLSNNLGNRFITRGETDVSDLGIATTSLKVMPPGTVLLSTRAPIGYMAIAREQVTTNQGFKSFVPNKGYSSEFIFETVRLYMPAIVGQSAGTTFKEVSKSDLGAVRIALAPKALADRLTELVAPIYQQQNVLELQNQELASLRDWLLPLLMNGQVVVAEAEEKVGLAMAAEANMEYQTKRSNGS